MKRRVLVEEPEKEYLVDAEGAIGHDWNALRT